MGTTAGDAAMSPRAHYLLDLERDPEIEIVVTLNGSAAQALLLEWRRVMPNYPKEIPTIPFSMNLPGLERMNRLRITHIDPVHHAAGGVEVTVHLLPMAVVEES